LRRTNRRRKKKKKNKKKKKKLIIMASYPPGRQNPGGQNPAWGRRPTQPFAMAHQPAAGLTQLPPPNSGTWTTGLCGCSRDLHSCCCATCCPCVLMGRIAEIVDEGSTSCLSAGCLFFWLLALAGSCFIYSYGYRARLRDKYGLPPKPCGDCCTDYWCICCSLAQETRELQNRGVNPALGWEANRSTYLKPPQIPKMQY
jgi:Cys-rich protein (TIGR01571 family)